MMPRAKKKKEKPSIEEITKCPQCGGTHLTKDYSRAELVCEDCGLVIDEDFIDYFGKEQEVIPLCHEYVKGLEDLLEEAHKNI